MKKLLSIVLLLCIAISLQARSFKNSAEKELEQYLEHFQNVYPEWTKEDLYAELKTYFIGNMYQVERIDSLMSRLQNSEDVNVINVVQQISDVHDIFHDLKRKMHIPDEVELWFIHNAVISEDDPMRQEAGITEETALYNLYERRVYISANFFGKVPATQLFALAHELTHVQQHQRLGLKKFKETSLYDIEHEADMNAITAIKCPVCIQLIADEMTDITPGGKYRSDFGYLSKKGAQQMNREKSYFDICDAHNADTQEAQNLRVLVFAQEKENGSFSNEEAVLDRLNLDWQCSQKAKHRLSTIRFEK